MAKRPSFKDLLLWEDDHYFVINKPPFVSTLDDRNDKFNILSLARDYHADAQVCHRLDKDTSGALIVAKDEEAYRHMSIQFEKREVNKVYHAVSDGIHEFRNHEASERILKLSNGSVKIDRKGKEANTFLETLKAYKVHTLIECRPISGRMHQIRIHLSHYGAPISGDSTYGGKPFYLSAIKRKYNLKRGEEEQPLIRRHALHAAKLSFSNLNNVGISVEAPYPKDFRVLIDQLDKNV